MPLTASAVAARHYGSALDALLSGSGDPLSDSEAAIAAEPQFALAHAARARALQLRGRFAEARQAAAQAVELAAGASDWEQRSTAITAALMNGDSDAAFRLLQEQMVRHPRDALSLSSAAGVFGLIGFSGRAGREPEQVAFLEPLAPHYGDDWWFQAVLAFAWLENDRATRARALVERSLQTFGRNAHGAHIYAHALIESGAADAGHEFLRTWLPDYPDEGMMHCSSCTPGAPRQHWRCGDRGARPACPPARRSTCSPTARRCCGARNWMRETTPERVTVTPGRHCVPTASSGSRARASLSTCTARCRWRRSAGAARNFQSVLPVAASKQYSQPSPEPT